MHRRLPSCADKEQIPLEIALGFDSVCGGRKLRVSATFTVRRRGFDFSCAQPVARNFHTGGHNSHKDTLVADSGSLASTEL